ncbi:alpha-L-fucosidase [Massilia horti]|uniref:Glycoside hydrolase family 29 N-terminal domain-containing protein n=1 Tax=Massilia horti TaxID=2562153 RepID=A0A4Y9T2P0_9BURK|nr:alpha-L-fucosidase [Massilia horti]TFW33707.1 hypothetical protein E4O92_05790 [Massilia horti]
MGPSATPAIVAAADAAVTTALPAGPFRTDWESIRQHYRPPAWFNDAKFGIFMHWGLSLPVSLGTVTKVERLGGPGLAFTQDEGGLHVQLGDVAQDGMPFALKISGLRLQ